MISILKELRVDTSCIELDARELDKYYITTRYPGQYGGPEGLYEKHEAEVAVVHAETVLNFVREQLLLG